MRIYPNFYQTFSCIGSNCLGTCCEGWKIGLDKNTVQKYQTVKGEFGEYIRKNIHLGDSLEYIEMDSDMRCPFLNETGLCQIYIQCGPDCLSDTCTRFPRRRLPMGKHQIDGLSLSCEEVLRILYNNESDLVLCVDGQEGESLQEVPYIAALADFIAWHAAFLQEESFAFGTALGTVLYTSLTAGEQLRNYDYSGMSSTLQQYTDIYQELRQAPAQLFPEDWECVAKEFLFNLTDTFCQIIREGNVFKSDLYLWDATYFEKSDTERKETFYKHLLRRNKSSLHKTFMRRVAVAFLMGHYLELDMKETKSILLDKFCNYMIMVEILPITWAQTYSEDSAEFFTRLAKICRLFDQTSAMETLISPVVHDLFQPNELMYTMAFMYLFD